MIEFTVAGEPEGKARPRLGRGGHTYTPRKTAAYEASVREAFLTEVYKHRPEGVELGEEIALDGPIRVQVIAYFRIPKSYSRKRREKILAGKEFPTKKPDIDNIEKIITDALNGLAYHDDSQIVWCLGLKVYGEPDEDPHVDVMIEEAGAE